MNQQPIPSPDVIIGYDNSLLLWAKKEAKLLRKQLPEKIQNDLLAKEKEVRKKELLEMTEEIDYSKHYSKKNRFRVVH